MAPAGPEEHATVGTNAANHNADGNQHYSPTPFAGDDNKGKAPAPAAAELQSGHEADGEGGLDREEMEKRKDFKPSTGLTSKGMLLWATGNVASAAYMLAEAWTMACQCSLPVRPGSRAAPCRRQVGAMPHSSHHRKPMTLSFLPFPLLQQTCTACTPGFPALSAEAAALLHQYGRNELEEKQTPSWLIYLRNVRARARRGPASTLGFSSLGGRIAGTWWNIQKPGLALRFPLAV